MYSVERESMQLGYVISVAKYVQLGVAGKYTTVVSADSLEALSVVHVPSASRLSPLGM